MQTLEAQEMKSQRDPLRIRIYGDPVLRRKAIPIRKITTVEKKLAEEMLATMYAEPNGVGLAAPQIGVLKRLVVIDSNRNDLDSKPLVLVNPQIQSLEGEVVNEEGCLSIPNVTADVKRARKAVVTARNIDGEEICVEGEEFVARVLQHEIDHLNGKRILDIQVDTTYVREEKKMGRERQVATTTPL